MLVVAVVIVVVIVVIVCARLALSACYARIFLEYAATLAGSSPCTLQASLPPNLHA